MLEGNDCHIFKANKYFLNREHQITSSNAYYLFWKHLGTVTSSVDRAILHERLVSLQVPDRWMTLMRSAQIQIRRETAERRFRKKLRRQMRNTTWIISSSDSDDDEVIFVSHAPGRSEGALNPWYPHFTPFRVIYFVYAHPCSLMRLSHHAFLLVSPWKRFLGDVPPHLLRECTGHRTEQNRTERGPRFVTDLCILFQFFFKDKQPVTLIWQCRFCRNVVFKECSSFIVCLKECWTSFLGRKYMAEKAIYLFHIIGPVN